MLTHSLTSSSTSSSDINWYVFTDFFIDFLSNDAYKNALKSAFEHVINIKPNMPAEYLSKYMDKKLRGEKGVDDSQNEIILTKSLAIFRYLLSKDTFEAFYKKHLGTASSTHSRHHCYSYTCYSKTIIII